MESAAAKVRRFKGEIRRAHAAALVLCAAFGLSGCSEGAIEPIGDESSLDGGLDAGPDADVPQPCETNEQCKNPLASRCGPKNFCIPCGDDMDCEGIPEGNVCIPEQGCFACSDEDKSACADPTAECHPQTHECVECTAANDSKCGDGEVCDEGSGKCVGCRGPGNDDCTTAAASVCKDQQCTSCAEASDCTHIPDTGQCHPVQQKCVQCWENSHCPSDKPVCDPEAGTCGACSLPEHCGRFENTKVCAEGECVQCTRAERSACDVDGKSYVCDATTSACDNKRLIRSKTLCNACVDTTNVDCQEHRDCVSNDECQDGQACVEVDAGGGVRSCLLIKTPTNTCPRPYNALTEAAVPSVDGPTEKVCIFGVSTTCQAHADYKNKRCGTRIPGNEAQDEPGSGDDSKCGVSDFEDGYCVFFEAQNQYRCTVPCNNDLLDCPDGATACNVASSPDLCNI